MKDYIKIARPDHWFKNVFMLPGVVLALVLGGVSLGAVWPQVLLAIVATCLIASANYTINEYLDAEFDRHHPVKKHRPTAAGRIKGKYVVVQYIVLSIVGLGIGYWVNTPVAITLLALLIMGFCYNVPPIRTKDRMYLDVLSESVNNPIRFALGWFSVTAIIFPPSSVIISYWFGGAFLMAVKRFAEYRHINDPAVAGTYRRSFRFYTEDSLLLSAFFYALTSVFFLGIFLVKYRVEFLLTFPLFALLFAWYLRIGIKESSVAQAPEKLYQERGFMAFIVFLVIVVAALVFIDLPFLNVLLETTSTGRQ